MSCEPTLLPDLKYFNIFSLSQHLSEMTSTQTHSSCDVHIRKHVTVVAKSLLMLSQNATIDRVTEMANIHLSQSRRLEAQDQSTSGGLCIGERPVPASERLSSYMCPHVVEVP